MTAATMFYYGPRERGTPGGVVTDVLLNPLWWLALGLAWWADRRSRISGPRTATLRTVAGLLVVSIVGGAAVAFMSGPAVSGGGGNGSSLSRQSGQAGGAFVDWNDPAVDFRPAPGHFFIGSTREEVRAAQGSPDSISEGEIESWFYGDEAARTRESQAWLLSNAPADAKMPASKYPVSQILFKYGVVFDVRLDVRKPLKFGAVSTGQRPRIFSQGSTVGEVLAAQGKPITGGVHTATRADGAWNVVANITSLGFDRGGVVRFAGNRVQGYEGRGLKVR